MHAEVMFGKLMSISDELMWRYFELLSFKPLAEIAALKNRVADGANPRDVKIELAKEIVARFHSASAAETALSEFRRALSRRRRCPRILCRRCWRSIRRALSLRMCSKRADLRPAPRRPTAKSTKAPCASTAQRVTDRALMVLPGADHIFQVGSRRFARLQLVPKSP